MEPSEPSVSTGIEHVPLLAGDTGFTVVAIVLTVGVLGTIGLLVRRRRGRRSNVPRRRDEPDTPVTDRERVLSMLSENGGRIKQAEIVDSVDWSKAKVSRLLAELEADGEITKLRLGRENLICKPGSEPAASRSNPRSGDDS
ncbi:helix-turn-helix transcriptional regulator [Halovivax cerinus]|uniref:Helix-turn-helix transcriptional regulator n=1 Tax=Halovivax cerinus TaxID=1487865 RepID=A0ABD5NNK5_9EURY|nr:MarR family transcriptional regulator [Halovivax cerinus]